jgi:endonuclease YncB( thermonuclease family)
MAEVFAGGRYLNQELLDHGWAVLYSKGGRRKR